MPTSYPRQPEKPWRITHEVQLTPEEAAGALLDFVSELHFAFVRTNTIAELATVVLQKNAPCGIPMDTVSGRPIRATLMREAKNEADLRRKKERLKHKGGDDEEGGDSLVDRPLEACKALIFSTFREFQYDPRGHEIAAIVSRPDARHVVDESGVVRVVINLKGSKNEFHRPLLSHVGSLNSFASEAHSTAKPATMKTAWEDLSKSIPFRPVDAETSPGARLVDTILGHKLSQPYHDQRTGQQLYRPVTLRTDPGIYAKEGLAVITEGGRRSLYVFANQLAGKLNPAEFRALNGAELADTLREAPGYKKRTRDGYTYRADLHVAFGGERAAKRLIRIDLDDYEAALDKDPATPDLSPEHDGRDPAPPATEPVQPDMFADAPARPAAAPTQQRAWNDQDDGKDDPPALATGTVRLSKLGLCEIDVLSNPNGQLERGVAHYTATLVSGNWPDDRELLAACDNGAFGALDRTFGGNVETPTPETKLVTVSVD